MSLPEEVAEGKLRFEVDEVAVRVGADLPEDGLGLVLVLEDVDDGVKGGEGPLGSEGKGDVDGRKGDGRAEVDDRLAAAKPQNEDEGDILANAVVVEGAFMFKLLTCKDEALIARRNPLYGADFGFQGTDRLARLNLEGSLETHSNKRGVRRRGEGKTHRCASGSFDEHPKRLIARLGGRRNRNLRRLKLDVLLCRLVFILCLHHLCLLLLRSALFFARRLVFADKKHHAVTVLVLLRRRGPTALLDTDEANVREVALEEDEGGIEFREELRSLLQRLGETRGMFNEEGLVSTAEDEGRDEGGRRGGAVRDEKGQLGCGERGVGRTKRPFYSS